MLQIPSLSTSAFTAVLFAPPMLLPLRTTPSRRARPGFDVGPGRPPIPPKLVDQIRNGDYVEFSELLPDSLRNNEVLRDLLLENQHLVIPKRPP